MFDPSTVVALVIDKVSYLELCKSSLVMEAILSIEDRTSPIVMTHSFLVKVVNWDCQYNA